MHNKRASEHHFDRTAHRWGPQTTGITQTHIVVQLPLWSDYARCLSGWPGIITQSYMPQCMCHYTYMSAHLSWLLRWKFKCVLVKKKKRKKKSSMSVRHTGGSPLLLSWALIVYFKVKVHNSLNLSRPEVCYIQVSISVTSMHHYCPYCAVKIFAYVLLIKHRGQVTSFKLTLLPL